MSLRTALLVFATLFVLIGCSSPEGPMLSDAEKLEKANKGRADYSRGLQGNAPSPAAAPGN